MFAAAAVLLAGLFIAAPPTQALADDAVVATPIERLGACLAGGGAGDIVLLIDESESVRETDPDGQRATAATYFVNQLATYAANNGADVSVQVATFAAEFTTLLGWTPLTESTLASVQGAVDGVRSRDSGWETDYWTALFGAHQVLADAAAAREGPSCQAVMWFSDGELWYNPTPHAELRPSDRKRFAPDLEIRGQAAADQAHDAAAQDLCRDGGLADQVRAAGIITFGIGLDTGSIPPGGFDLMESIVTGHAQDGTACGRLTDPVPGTFFVVSDIDALLFAFDELSTPGEPPIRQERGICQVVVCTDNGHRIVLDESAPHVTILASSTIDGASVSVQPPSGAVVTIPDGGSGTLDIDGATATYSWQSARTVALSIDGAGARAWSGLWQLAFTDPTGSSAGETSRSNIRVAGALVPAWTNEAEVALHAGGVVADLEIGLARRDGQAADPSIIRGELDFSASFRDSRGDVVVIVDTRSPGDLAGTFALDLTGVALGPGTVSLSSRITTAATEFDGEQIPGTRLQAETVTIPVTVLPPLDYPLVAPSIDFGAVEAERVSLTATLAVSGDGCVRFAGTPPEIVAGPEGIGQVRIAPADEDACHPASEGGVPLTLTTEASGNGALSGSFVVSLEPAGAGPSLETTVTFTASMLRPLDLTNFLVVLIAALVLGPGLPLVLLYGFKWLGSTIPSRVLYGFVTPIEVSGDRVLRDGAPFALRDTDAANQVSVPQRARRLTVGGVGLRTLLGASPFGRGHVVVDSPGTSSASGAAPYTDRTGLRARLPLDVHNNWVVLRTPGDPAGKARLLVLLPGVDTRTREQYERRVADGVPARLKALVEAERAAGTTPAEPAAPPTAGSDIWGGGSPSSPSGSAPRPANAADPWGTSGTGTGSGGGSGGAPPPPNPFA